MASAPDPSMRRVLVIGSPGAGKIHARDAARARGSACRFTISICTIGSRAGSTATTAEARERVRALAETPEWVMDGNFAETFDLRMPRADTLVWLDYPRATCIRRILLRTHQGLWQAEAGSARRVPGEIRCQRCCALPGVFPRKPAADLRQFARYGGHLNVFRLANDRDVAEFSRSARDWTDAPGSGHRLLRRRQVHPGAASSPPRRVCRWSALDRAYWRSAAGSSRRRPNGARRCAKLAAEPAVGHGWQL